MSPEPTHTATAHATPHANPRSTLTKASAATLWRLGLAACVAAAAGLAGCRSAPEPEPERPTSALIAPDNFRVAWRARVDSGRHGQVDRLFLRDDSVFAYTDDKVVQRLTAAGGQTQFIASIVRPNEVLQPPLVLGARGRAGALQRLFAFPTATGFVLVNDAGDVVDRTTLPRSLTTPAVAMPDGNVLVGTADDRGGRLVKVDPTRQSGAILERVQLGALAGRPAAFASRVFAADLNGNVYGMTDRLRQAWSIDAFRTEAGRAVNADLTADDFGVYASGTDGTLNVLSRDRGRLLWRYFAGRPLFEQAFPVGEWVYQAVLDGGVVALPKFEGSRNSRQPAWTAPDARTFLSHDATRVYLLQNDGRVAAHDKQTGAKLFVSQRTDFTRFARNVNGPRFFAATRGGEIVAIEPVVGRGVVGEVALGTPSARPRHAPTTPRPRPDHALTTP